VQSSRISGPLDGGAAISWMQPHSTVLAIACSSGGRPSGRHPGTVRSMHYVLGHFIPLVGVRVVGVLEVEGTDSGDAAVDGAVFTPISSLPSSSLPAQPVLSGTCPIRSSSAQRSADGALACHRISVSGQPAEHHGQDSCAVGRAPWCDHASWPRRCWHSTSACSTIRQHPPPTVRLSNLRQTRHAALFGDDIDFPGAEAVADGYLAGFHRDDVHARRAPAPTISRRTRHRRRPGAHRISWLMW